MLCMVGIDDMTGLVEEQTEIESDLKIAMLGTDFDAIYHALKGIISKIALQKCKQHNGYLKDGLEEQAFKMLSQIQKKSEEMCEILENLTKNAKMNLKLLINWEQKLKKQRMLLKQKIETDKQVSKNKLSKDFHEKEIKESNEEVDKKKDITANTSDDEKNCVKKEKKIQKKSSKKNLKLRTKLHKAKLTSDYDRTSEDIEYKLKNLQHRFEKILLSKLI